MRPYVGVTGVANIDDVRGVEQEFADAGYTMGSPHIPMMGFLVSYKTLLGLPTLNRRYPSFRDLPMLIGASGAFNMVHFNSRDMPLLAHDVGKVFERVYPQCRALQLNIHWPWPYQVSKIKERFADLDIVFQASRGAMDDKSPAEIASGIKAYGDSLSYVLIDPSQGRGMPFDVEHSLNVYTELKLCFPELTIGFAGGFTGENVAERLEMIIGRTGDTDFCIDAEGGLRDKVSPAYGDDLLNIRKVRDYLQAASSVLR